MIKEELYNRTVDVLVKAYFEDTLVINSCTACACGNLIMAANNYKEVHFANIEDLWVDTVGNYRKPLWTNVVGTPDKKIFGISIGKGRQYLNISEYEGEAMDEILSTGYRLHEFALIENAFEKGFYKKKVSKDRMFDALISVVEALDKIHENTDTTITTQAKKRFQKEPA